MASNGQPQGHTKGAPVPLAMHTKEQPPANAYAHHNTITKAIFHGAQGCTSTRHAQRQACHVQVPFPLAMSMHPCHAQGRLGARPKPATSKLHAPQCISQSTRVNPQGLPPSIDQPFSTTKMGVAGPADCALETLVRVNDFLERIPPIKANPVGEGRDPFQRLRK